MKIALLGYGKMGKTIERLAVEKGHEIVYTASSSSETGNLKAADCAIEFSLPGTAVSNIKRCFEENIPVVSGTTGWLDAYDEVLNFCKNSNGSFIYASNFSIGVNLFFSMNDYLAQLMKPWADYVPSLTEIHHTQKLDAPSGTAITLAEGILKHSKKKGWKLDSTEKEHLSIEAKRIEDVKGTHMVDYTSPIDTITLQHEAHTRDGFALGAILAAEWLVGKTGVFTMKDVLNLK
ncbi:MAG: 4-hydroxy-tetrahydrodipicolinate reductase [Flavobacteriaceae bacterium]|nr:4-hydroxy-tetrahydrodipicolinate reductase [Flavobacteriaceae bacterium]